MVWHASLFQTRPAHGLLQIVLQVLRFCRVRENKHRQLIAAAGRAYLLWSVTTRSGPSLAGPRPSGDAGGRKQHVSFLLLPNTIRLCSEEHRIGTGWHPALPSATVHKGERLSRPLYGAELELCRGRWSGRFCRSTSLQAFCTRKQFLCF